MSRFHVDVDAVILERRKKEGQFNMKSRDKHWGQVIAEKLVEENPNPKNGIYTCAAGITPSGMVHFGNFREIMTNWPVVEALRAMGKKARLMFVWDEYDRFRKVPSNIPADFEQYIGLPVSELPCPEGEDESYARHFQKPLEDVLERFGIDVEFKYQAKEYKTGQYAELISKALNEREKIAGIIWSFMSESSREKKGSWEEYSKAYWPGVIYSSFTGKDNTQILEFDGEFGITYKCLDTDNTETIDIRKQPLLKLGWKVDWPMRWSFEGVIFEPGGKDHSTFGGSYDVCSVIAREIFGIEPPFYQPYDFIGIKGIEGKMSSSKGNALTPAQLLEVYELPILKWVYTRALPTKPFDLAFDSDIIRLYDEYDKNVRKTLENGKIDGSVANGLRLAFEGVAEVRLLKPASFRQLTGWAQVVNWDLDKLMELFEAQGLDFERESVQIRLEKARNWMETYNADELLVLRDDVNAYYVSAMDDLRKGWVSEMKEFLSDAGADLTIADVNEFMYSVPKEESLEMDENKVRQRQFFTDIYNLLISKDKGPRLSTFLWALDRRKVVDLLDIS